MRYSTHTVIWSGPVKRNPKYNYPIIKIQGKWLEGEDFEVGDRIKVVANKGTITINKIK